MRGEQFLKSAFSYLFIGDYGNAMEAFRRAIEDNPQNSVFAFHGSVTALRNGDLDLAERWAVRALSNDPEHPLYRRHLERVRSQISLKAALQALHAGDVGAARAMLEQSIATDPLNESAHDLWDHEFAWNEEVDTT